MLVRNLALSAVAAAGLAGCVANSGDQPLLVLHNQVPQSGCVLTADNNGSFLAAGIVDVGALRQAGATSVRGYFLTPLVENTAFADTTDPSATLNRTAVVNGAHVSIDFLDPSEATGTTQFDARFAGAIDPNDGLTTFGFEAVPADVLNGILANHPADTPYTPFADIGLIASITVYGDMGGNSIESNTFEYPISVCDGCLTSYVGLCSALPSGYQARTGGACYSNQDGILDCCLDDSGAAVCPATPPATGGA